jgi:Bacterial archaeo-eukaryotic release factor family 10
MLTWNDIRSIDSIDDPLGVLSVYVDRPDQAAGRLVRAVALAGELRRLEADVAQDGRDELAAAYRECLLRIRPALAAMLDGSSAGRALFAPLSSEEVFEIGLGLPMGVAVALEQTAYVRPLVAAFDEGRPAGVMVAAGAAVQLFQWQMCSVEETGEYRFTGTASAWRRRGAALATRLANEVHEIAAERRWTRILVAGDGRLAHALAVTGAATGREVSMITRPVEGLRPRGIAAVVGSDLYDAQRQYELRLVERVVQAAVSDRTAVLGVTGTVRALEERRVDHLLFDGERDYRWSETMAGMSGAWPRRDPAEALIELALHSGADITPLEGESRRPLADAGGIAAVLR